MQIIPIDTTYFFKILFWAQGRFQMKVDSHTSLEFRFLSVLVFRFSLVDLKNMAAANDGSLEFATGSGGGSSSSNNSNTCNMNIGSNSNSSVSSGSSNPVPVPGSVINPNAVTMPAGYVTSSTAQQQQQQQHQHQHQHPMTMDPRYGCGAPPALLPPPPLPALGPPPRSLEQLIIYENFDVHETHRIEDGVCTHISRLPPKKQELLKQFGIQSSSQHCLSNYEKYILIENFIKFCNVSKSVSKADNSRRHHCSLAELCSLAPQLAFETLALHPCRYIHVYPNCILINWYQVQWTKLLPVHYGIELNVFQLFSSISALFSFRTFAFRQEYQISDHRPFLDFHESALSKCEQLKFVRYLGQGLSNLTLNKIYVAFKELLGNGRPEKWVPKCLDLSSKFI